MRSEEKHLSLRKKQYDNYFASKRGIGALSKPHIDIDNLNIPFNKKIDIDHLFKVVRIN